MKHTGISNKILVTGATGFLGKRLCKNLKEAGFHFVPTSLSTGLDLRNCTEAEDFLKKVSPDIVINCAAYVGGIAFGLRHEGELFYNNIQISTNLFEASRKAGVKKIINPISNCSYPDVIDKHFVEEEWWDGQLHQSVLVYGFVRKAVWVNSYAYANQYGMKFVNLLVPNMYGPDDHFDEMRSHALGALVMKIVNAKMKQLPSVTVWGTGKPVREWMYVDDCVNLLTESIEKDVGLNPINIGSGVGVSISKLAQHIVKAVDYKGKLIFDTSKPDGAPFKIMKVNKMKKYFTNIPKTTLIQGIKATVNWYNKQQIGSR